MSVKDFFKTGLTTVEVRKRLDQFGRNQLVEKKKLSSLSLFFSQFKSPLIYILVIAGLVTSFYGQLADSTVIFAAIFLNTLLGFYQERKAQRSMEALRGMLAPRARVIRDGQTLLVPATEVVPGDLAVLTIGDRVPADGILVKAKDLSVSEAILTGESMPVSKLKVKSERLKSAVKKMRFGVIPGTELEVEDKNKVFMGTIVSTGIGQMLVVKTGMATRMGLIGRQVEAVKEEKTPLQVQLSKLAQLLASLVGLITVLIFLFGRYRGHEALEMFNTSVAVAVAAIPEGLVVTLTVILALGMQRILKRKAIVRRLLAAETLGSVTIICADKTGTLTEGKMRAVKAVTELSKKSEVRSTKRRGGDSKLEWLTKGAILCNDMRDPLEVAMEEWALRLAFGKLKLAQGKPKSELIKKRYPRVDEIPFSPSYKYIATLHRFTPGVETGYQQENTPGLGTLVLFVSGAPEVVLRKCGLSARQTKAWLDKFDDLGHQGYRLVGFAYKKVQRFKDSKAQKAKIKKADIGGLRWLGVLVYEDPVRVGVKEVLNDCRRAGIRVKVITGDYASTASAVLAKLGTTIDARTQLITGDELEEISGLRLKQKIEDVVLFARTTPEQKLKIVQTLKEKGEVVAMTGDGVNDAPALAMADIGIVVGEASDVAKETADMVLLDSNFKTIVEAVEEGRNIFENIKKVVLYLLSGSFSEVVLIGGSLLLGLPLPVTAAQILWVNLVEDALPGMALAFEPEEQELMKELPRPKDTSILGKQMKLLVVFIGAILNLTLLALAFWLGRGLFHFRHVNTLLFVALGIDSLFIGFACRSLRKPFFRYNLFGNWYLNGAVVLSFLMLLMAVYFPPLQRLLGTHPLDAGEWVFLTALGFFSFLTIEVAKWLFIARKTRP